MTLLSRNLSRFLIIGNSFFDVIAQIDSEENGRNQLAHVETRLGGVFNVSRKLNIHGVNHEIFSVLGSPLSRESSERFMSDLDRSIVNLNNLQFTNEDMCLASIIINKKLSQRTSFVRTGVGKNLEISERVACGKSYIHISYLDYLSSLKSDTIERWVDSNIFVSADLCLNEYAPLEQSRVLRLFQKLSLLFMSDTEYEALFRIKPNLTNVSENDALPKVTAIHFQDRLIVKNLNQTFEIPGVKYRNVASLAFGDNFVAYFFVSFFENKDVNTALVASFNSCQADARKAAKIIE